MKWQITKSAIIKITNYILTQKGDNMGIIDSLNEKVINDQAKKGYRLHTISTASAGSSGLMGGDRIQATMVFEKAKEK